MKNNCRQLIECSPRRFFWKKNPKKHCLKRSQCWFSSFLILFQQCFQKIETLEYVIKRLRMANFMLFKIIIYTSLTGYKSIVDKGGNVVYQRLPHFPQSYQKSFSYGTSILRYIVLLVKIKILPTRCPCMHM